MAPSIQHRPHRFLQLRSSCLAASARGRVAGGCLFFAICASATFGIGAGAGEHGMPAPVLSDTALQPSYFKLPGPRGQILDRHGKPLARTAVGHRLMLRVPAAPEESAESYAAWVDEVWPEIAILFPEATRPDAGMLKQHFEHRRRLPLPVSNVMRDVTDGKPLALPEFLEWQTEYFRDYPGGGLAAHLVGYVTANGPPLRGPLLHAEPLWREVAGRMGLEASMNQHLTGQPGLMVVCHDKDGRAIQRHVLKPAAAGRDVVTTLDRDLQEAVEKHLAAAGRAGAMVIVDAAGGGILALASAPDFDPGAFALGMDSQAFAGVTNDSKKPLFNRGIAALYPPGSVFKLVVALAGLRHGSLHPGLPVACWPQVTIDGRLFGNWSATERGWFNLNAALVRSCNPYFYQAAIAMGDQPILETARDLGFGAHFDLPLRGTVTGRVPEAVPSAQGQANMSIGQSPILSTPLEVAMAMAAIANGGERLRPRLVAQVQEQSGSVLFATQAVRDKLVSLAPEHVSLLHESMFSVVNHRNGTGSRARVKNLRVFGKTGTSQWSREGSQVTAVWFAGFVKDCNPPLAFSLAIEGGKGESISGGNTAAPVVGKVLAQVAAEPAKFGLRITKVAVPYQQFSLGDITNAAMPRGIKPPEIGRSAVAGLAPWDAGYPAVIQPAVPRAIPVAEPAYPQSLPSSAANASGAFR